MIPMHTPLLSHRPQSTSIFFVIQSPSAQYFHRYVQPARDVLHGDPFAALPVHLVAGHEVEQLFYRDPAFHPGQRRAQATVNPVPQTEVLCLGVVTLDVECVRVGEGIGISVRRGFHQEHRLAGGNRATGDVCFFQGPADVVLNRSFVAQQLFDGARDFAAVFLQLLPLVWVAGEQYRRATDQLGDCLSAPAAQQRRKTADLDVVQTAHRAVIGGNLGGDQPADHVVLRLGAALLHQAVVVHRRVDVGLHAFFAELDLAWLPVQAGVNPVPYLLTVVRRHSGHRGDDFDRERPGEVLDDVEMIGIDRTQVFFDHFDDWVVLRLDGSWGGRLVDQAAHVAVLRGVHEDDGPLLGGYALAHHRQVAAARGRESLEVLERGSHVLMAGQRVEVLFLVVVERGVLTHSSINVERVGEVLLGERIKDDLWLGHCTLLAAR